MMKVKVSDIDANNMNAMPEEAAYFGDKSGDEIAKSI